MKPENKLTRRSVFYTRSVRGLILLAGIALASPVISLPVWAAYNKMAISLVNPGDAVTLHNDINLNLGARIYIQYGQEMPFSDVYELDPYCYFYFYRSSDNLKTPITLTAGRYRVTKVNNHRMSSLTKPEQYAFIGLGNGGGSQYTMATKFTLDSPENPELNSLICGVWASLAERRFLSLREITDTLGELVTINTGHD